MPAVQCYTHTSWTEKQNPQDARLGGRNLAGLGIGAQSHRGGPGPQLLNQPPQGGHREGRERSQQLTRPGLGIAQQSKRGAMAWAEGKSGTSHRLPCLMGREVLAPDAGLHSSLRLEVGLKPSCPGEPLRDNGSSL